MSCDVGHRHGLDLVWLWRRPVTTAPNQPLAWELPYTCSTKKKVKLGVPFMAQWLTNPASIHEEVGSIPGLTHWVKDLELP